MEIKSTSNYELFETITGNRVVNNKKIEKLTEDVQNGLNLLPYCPIVVYKEGDIFKIVDGQHRFETAKVVESPVYFVECEKLSLLQIARLNSRSDKWSNKDFLSCYIKLGIEDYKILQDFMNEYETIYSASIDLLMYGNINRKTNSMQEFRDGEFKVNFLKLAKEVTALTIDIFERYKFRTDRRLIAAVQQLKEKGLCDFEILKQKISAAPMLMDQQGSTKEYIYNIERVYNHNNQKRIIIF